MVDKFKELQDSLAKHGIILKANTEAITKDTIARGQDTIARGKGGRIDKPTGGSTDLSGIDLGKDAKTVAVLDDIKGSLHTLVSTGVALKLQGLDLKDLKALGGTGKDAASYLTGLTDQSEAFKKTSDALADLNKHIGFQDINFNKVKEGIKEFGIEGLAISTDQAVDKLKELAKHSLTARNILASNAEGSEKAAGRLAAFASQAEKAGVDSETFAKALDIVNFDLGLVGKNGEGAEKAMNKMMGEALTLSAELNSPLGTTLKSLSNQFPELTVLGGSFVNNMAELNRVSQRTGTSLEGLVNMGKKFNTIEGASQQIGNLSAVLKGTNLEVGELISAEPADRVKMVLKDIKSAMDEGRFNLAEGGMERVYQVQALAQSAGIAEADMNKLLQSQHSVDELFAKRADAANKTVEQNKQDVKAQMGASEKIKAAPINLKNAIVMAGTAQKDFNRIVADSSKIMEKHATAVGNAIHKISTAVSGVKTSADTWKGEGPDSKAGLFGQLLFGQRELFDQRVEDARGLTTDLSELIKTLDKQMEAGRQTIQDAKDQQEGKPPAGQPLPASTGAGTAAPKNQQITKQPNGDIKVNVSQEFILPANLLKDSVMQQATRQIN